MARRWSQGLRSEGSASSSPGPERLEPVLREGMKAVLLDRDGVINSLVYHEDAGVIDSPFTTSQFKLLPRVPAAIRHFNKLGLRVAVVSNQPGIAKGYLRRKTLQWFEKTMVSAIRSGGGEIDAIYYCLHHPEAKIRKYRKRCRCRKPAIGLLQQAAADLNVSLQECYMVGDGISDLLAGTRAGCRTVFIGRWKCEICQFTESPEVRPCLVAKDLWEACHLIGRELNNANPSVRVVGSCAAAK
jgi:histidinol-phosphate phosphatase family protein